MAVADGDADALRGVAVVAALLSTARGRALLATRWALAGLACAAVANVVVFSRVGGIAGIIAEKTQSTWMVAALSPPYGPMLLPIATCAVPAAFSSKRT